MGRIVAPLLVAVALAGSGALPGPRSATLEGPLSLDEALSRLRAQTGNSVGDLRSQKTNPTLALPRSAGHFWPLLDAIGKASGIGFTPYGNDGVALVDTPYQAVPTAYSGLFRLSLKGVTTSLNFDTRAHFCHLALDVAWEPHLQPFYLDPGTVDVSYGGQKQSVNVRGQVSVAGRTATEIDLRLPAPPRSTPRIASLEGRLAVIAPSRLLDFSFDKLAPIAKGAKPRQLTEDGVTVSLNRLSAARDRWSVEVKIENPPGGPAFETFQSWLDNNKIWLERQENGKTIVWPHDPAEEQVQQVTARRAQVSYHFPLGERRPGNLADWTLRYRTPARIVQLDVPFKLEDIQLP